MATANKVMTDETRSIEQALRTEFSDVQAYRYNPASIRVRVIDEQFTGLSRVERHELAAACIRALPEEIQQDITVLLLLAPDETDTSMMNIEFEHPSPSSL